MGCIQASQHLTVQYEGLRGITLICSKSYCLSSPLTTPDIGYRLIKELGVARPDSWRNFNNNNNSTSNTPSFLPSINNNNTSNTVVTLCSDGRRGGHKIEEEENTREKIRRGGHKIEEEENTREKKRRTQDRRGERRI
ncbi:hypothetical protein Pmani_007995 [Petrolisthes manimaculis]|uniref:Uncharacterized protein n=1 Tax=Petrolisthes manimaculis TaxID=1843537 RepID=A0AAE1Q7V3_9EUCA|nr:hypothetical protein Pmani_007995 [Petrolisthes manimaculis]